MHPRRWVQGLFLALSIYVGLLFWFYVNQFVVGGTDLGLAHPDGVEAFLPIGGLTSLRYFLSSGNVHSAHPAALVVFGAALLVSIVLKKSFCGWICPVGFLSELTYQPWKKYFGKNVKFPRALDLILRLLKYLVLGFFVFILGIKMNGEQALEFLNSDYWVTSDVRMLYFFTHMSGTTVVVMGVLVALSIPTRNFWCRFLCPYGALTGIVGKLSLFKVRRNVSLCHECGKCTRGCPAHLPVASSAQISSAECTSCLTCVAGCPAGALSYSLKRQRFLKLTPWRVGFTIVSIFLGCIGVAKGVGVWKSQIAKDQMYQLVPLVMPQAGPEAQ